MKKVLVFMFGLLFVISLSACDKESGDNRSLLALLLGGGGNGEQANIAVTSVTLNKATTSILVGGTEQLVATIMPANATNKSLTWTSSKKDKATVSASGLVTALDGGDTIITIRTAHGGFTASCTVTVSTTFSLADTPGDIVAVAANDLAFNMIYVNNQENITFPVYSRDQGTATLTRKFFLGETEVTNALFAEVLEWARGHIKIIPVPGQHNELSATTVLYGYQELINLDYDPTHMKIRYNERTNTFSVDPGYENHPVVCVSWYGAIMFCNWLTEMQDGNTNNLVYSGIDTSWDHLETVEDASKTGYRLPSNREMEFAARYIGTVAPTVENLATEYVARGHNDGLIPNLLTPGYYWTPGNYASGAIKDYTNAAETGAVAWYEANSGSRPKVVGTAGTGGTTPKTGNANALGIYDMSGNVWEWCFTILEQSGSSFRVRKGGSWNAPNTSISVSGDYWDGPSNKLMYQGFRLAKTK